MRGEAIGLKAATGGEAEAGRLREASSGDEAALEPEWLSAGTLRPMGA